MAHLRLAIDQMAPRLGDIDANLKEHREAIRWAKKQRAELLVFPELSLVGYQTRGMTPQVAMKPFDERLLALSGYAGGLGLIVGIVEKAPGGQYYNSAAYLKDGMVQGIQRKAFLPNYGMFDEKRFFAGADKTTVFDTPWGKIGVLVCFDTLHPVAAYLHEQAGARILITISNTPVRGLGADGYMGAADLFCTAQRAHARLLGLFAVYVNRVGSEEGMTFWGGSHVLDPSGNAVVELPEYEAARAVCEIDLDAIDHARTLFPHLKESRPSYVLQEMWRLRVGRPDLFYPSSTDSESDLTP